jgi:hypothetical protein
MHDHFIGYLASAAMHMCNDDVELDEYDPSPPREQLPNRYPLRESRLEFGRQISDEPPMWESGHRHCTLIRDTRFRRPSEHQSSLQTPPSPHACHARLVRSRRHACSVPPAKKPSDRTVCRDNIRKALYCASHLPLASAIDSSLTQRAASRNRVAATVRARLPPAATLLLSPTRHTTPRPTSAASGQAALSAPP